MCAPSFANHGVEAGGHTQDHSQGFEQEWLQVVPGVQEEPSHSQAAVTLCLCTHRHMVRLAIGAASSLASASALAIGATSALASAFAKDGAHIQATAEHW